MEYHYKNFPLLHSPSLFTFPSAEQCTPSPCGSPEQNSPRYRSPLAIRISPIPCGRQLQTGPAQTMPFSKRMRVRPIGTPSTNSPSINRPPRSSTYPSPVMSFTDPTLYSNSNWSQRCSRRTKRRNRYAFYSPFFPLPPDDSRRILVVDSSVFDEESVFLDLVRRWGILMVLVVADSIGCGLNWKELVRERMGRRKSVKLVTEGCGYAILGCRLAMRHLLDWYLPILRILWLRRECSLSSTERHYCRSYSSIIYYTARLTN